MKESKNVDELKEQIEEKIKFLSATWPAQFIKMMRNTSNVLHSREDIKGLISMLTELKTLIREDQPIGTDLPPDYLRDINTILKQEPPLKSEELRELLAFVGAYHNRAELIDEIERANYLIRETENNCI